MLYDRMIEPMVKKFAGGSDTNALRDREELLRLARESVDESAPSDSSPIGIIGSAARAAEMTVEDIMIPRPDIVAYPVDTPPGALLDAMLGEGYTRVPIYDDNIDKVLGSRTPQGHHRAGTGQGGGRDSTESSNRPSRYPSASPSSI